MKLVVAEKPSVGRTIAAVLGAKEKKDGCLEGSGYIVTWCVGHLVELALPTAYDPKYAQQPWKMEDLPIFPGQWKFQVNKTTADQYKIVKQLMLDERVSEIICATDAGREGECIFRYVYNMTGSKKPVKRLWTSSLEESAIRKGFQELKPDADYDNLYAAGVSRSKADWLVGMNASRLFSIKYRRGLTIGRVQTPTLAMIVQRDYDIAHFVKQKYYTVEMDCGDFIAATARTDDESFARNLAEICNGKSAVVTAVTKETKTVNPPKLYDLTTLQREANKLFGYTAKQTLDYAQSLYDAKLATYPRTDSQYLTEDMEQTALDMLNCIRNTFPQLSCGISFDDIDHSGVKRCMDNSKVSDHTAIIPTAEIKKADLSALPTGEKNILLLISAKLLIATSEPHRYESVKVSVTSESATSSEFYATGKKILTAYDFKVIESHVKEVLTKKKVEEKEVMLPEIAEGQCFENVSTKTAEHFTSPPKPYTDDTLLAAMERAGNDDYEDDDVEKKGIGTPATRAGIIENLVDRQYIERQKKKLMPTQKGIQLIALVPEHLKSAKTTAQWDTVLQHIEQGKSEMSADAFIDGIEEQIRQLLAEYGSSVSEGNPFQTERAEIGVCPKCGKAVREYPKSFSCESGKDGCGFVIWKTVCGKEISAVQAGKLLNKKKSDLLRGFKSKAGKAFNAYLVMKPDFTVGFEFESKKK